MLCFWFSVVLCLLSLLEQPLYFVDSFCPIQESQIKLTKNLKTKHFNFDFFYWLNLFFDSFMHAYSMGLFPLTPPFSFSSHTSYLLPSLQDSCPPFFPLLSFPPHACIYSESYWAPTICQGLCPVLGHCKPDSKVFRLNKLGHREGKWAPGLAAVKMQWSICHSCEWCVICDLNEWGR